MIVESWIITHGAVAVGSFIMGFLVNTTSTLASTWLQAKIDARKEHHGDHPG